MLNEELTIENDEILNSCDQCKNRQVIPEFDFTNDIIDLEDNDSYFNEENDEYTKPICNDSTFDNYEDVRVQYTEPTLIQ